MSQAEAAQLRRQLSAQPAAEAPAEGGAPEGQDALALAAEGPGYQSLYPDFYAPSP